jgi:hypothetical protein
MILAVLTGRVITLGQGFLSFPPEYSIHIIGKERFELLTGRIITLGQGFLGFPLNTRSTSSGRKSTMLAQIDH